MPIAFNERSLGLLSNVDPRLRQLMMATEAEADRRGIDFEISEGMRDRARQAQLVAQGASQTMNSRHLTGNAVDINIRNPDGSINWDFEAYRPIADIARQQAANLGIDDFTWGGDWRTLRDGVHFQVGGRGQPQRQDPYGLAEIERSNNLPSGYLARLGQIESGWNPTARNDSGASGIFQFMPFNFEPYGITDPFDVNQQLRAIVPFTEQNRQQLRSVLGREPEARELYLAHQQGAGGAAQLLANPNAPAHAIVGQGAVLQNGGSIDMTAREFAQHVMNYYEGGSDPDFAGVERVSTQNVEGGPPVAFPEQQRRPSIWDAVPFLNDPERRARLAIALEGMTLNPNQGLIAANRDLLTEERDARRLNQTVEWLRQQPGGEQFAAALATGAIDPNTAFGGWFESQRPAAPVEPVTVNGQLVNPQTGEVIGDYRTQEPTPQGFRPLTPDEVAAIPGLDPNRAYQVNQDTGQITAVGGGPVAEVNVGAGESAFEEEVGKNLAQEAADIVTTGMQAQRALGQITTLEQQLSQLPGGVGSSWAAIAGNFGIEVEGTSQAQAATAIINQLIPQQRPPGSGQMSDRDVELFRQSVPRLINTPEGNQMIIDTMKSIMEYDVARMEIARAQQLGEIDAREAFRRYAALGNPIPDAIRQQQGAQQGEQSQRATGQTDALSDDQLLERYGTPSGASGNW